MSRSAFLLTICMAFTCTGCSVSRSPHQSTKKKPPIVLVAFGSTRPSVKKTFDFIENKYRRSFPDRDIRWAYTSEIVRKRLAKKGVFVASPKQMATTLIENGYTTAIFQSLHVVPGQEFQEIRNLKINGLQINVGTPLLYDNTDISAVTKLLLNTVAPEEVAVFVAHGNEQHPPYNNKLIALKSSLESRKKNGFLCSVEGDPPGTSSLESARSLAKNTGAVTFVPVMIVNGVHMHQDIMGDAPDSWKNLVGAAHCRLAAPLGENPDIVSRFIQHTRNAINTSLVKNTPKKKKKTGLAFVLSKTKLLFKLGLYIVAGVLVANILELLDVMRLFAFLTWPITFLGRIHRSCGPAFLMAFQSGAIANSILVTNRDNGIIDNRQLYSSVLVVSCLSLFAHLPTYVLPIGAVLGPEATTVLFATRFAAIVVEIVAVLIFGSFIVKYLQKHMDHVPETDPSTTPERRKAKDGEKETPRSFFNQVWNRSRKTLLRLLFYVVPTFVIMGALEYFGLFSYLSRSAPGLFSLDFLPAESAIVIPAQALSLYNGAVAAAGFVDSGDLAVKQAVLIILAGSIITAPIRTLKHAMPTYIAILGVKAGTVLSISAQILRSIFLILATVGMWFIW